MVTTKKKKKRINVKLEVSQRAEVVCFQLCGNIFTEFDPTEPDSVTADVKVALYSSELAGSFWSGDSLIHHVHFVIEITITAEFLNAKFAPMCVCV